MNELVKGGSSEGEIDWEAKLAAEGLGADVSVDPGKEALMEKDGVGRTPERQAEITEALMNYWIFRDPSAHYDHKRMAKAGSQDLGLGPNEVDVTEVEAVGDLVTDMENAFHQAARSIAEKNPAAARSARRLANMAVSELSGNYSGVSSEVLGNIAEMAATKVVGY
jgi:hypothetical protein